MPLPRAIGQEGIGSSILFSFCGSCGRWTFRCRGSRFAGLASAGAFLKRLSEGPASRQGDPRARSKEHRARRQRFQYSHTDVSLSGRERADVVTKWRRRRRGQQPTAVAWWAAYPLSARSCEKVETARPVSWGFLVAGGLGRPCFLFQGASCLCCWRLRVLRALERS